MLQLEEYWVRILENDFSYGFFWGASVVIGILLVLWVLNLLCALCCRTKRCRELSLSSGGGELTLSEGAVIAAVKILGDGFPWFELRRIRLCCRRGSGYQLRITAGYELSGERSLPEEVEKFRSAVKGGLSSMLGLPESVEICVALSGVRSGSEHGGMMGSENMGEPVSETESGFPE